jgi:hypothetical protein
MRFLDIEVIFAIDIDMGIPGGPDRGEITLLHRVAFALLSYARNRLKCTPQLVLFDSWSPSKRLRKRLRDSGGYLVCQLKKNRRFDGSPLRT